MLVANIKSIKIKNHPKSSLLLKNIEFSLSSNRIYTIMGKNGSGKSTLLLAITGLLDKTRFEINGKVELDKVNLFELSEKELIEIRKKKIRFIFQDPISTFDPLKKIKYYFELFNFSLNEIENELKYFQLPNYSKISELYPYQISTGMAQRINIVLALLNNPDILLLDEPTSALDLPIASLVQKRLQKYVTQQNKVVLLVTQDMPFAKAVSNYTAIMGNGTLSKFELN